MKQLKILSFLYRKTWNSKLHPFVQFLISVNWFDLKDTLMFQYLFLFKKITLPASDIPCWACAIKYHHTIRKICTDHISKLMAESHATEDCSKSSNNVPVCKFSPVYKKLQSNTTITTEWIFSWWIFQLRISFVDVQKFELSWRIVLIY